MHNCYRLELFLEQLRSDRHIEILLLPILPSVSYILIFVLPIFTTGENMYQWSTQLLMSRQCHGIDDKIFFEIQRTIFANINAANWFEISPGLLPKLVLIGSLAFKDSSSVRLFHSPYSSQFFDLLQVVLLCFESLFLMTVSRHHCGLLTTQEASSTHSR